MATWQVGPFDNDDAVEWCGALEHTTPDQRSYLVRRTLEVAVSAGRALAPEDAARAIAAAATVLQSITGVPVSNSAYAPHFLLDRDDIPVNSPLRELATRSLDAVLADESSWRLRWAENIEGEEALRVIEDLRVSLADSGAVESPQASD